MLMSILINTGFLISIKKSGIYMTQKLCQGRKQICLRLSRLLSSKYPRNYGIPEKKHRAGAILFDL